MAAAADVAGARAATSPAAAPPAKSRVSGHRVDVPESMVTKYLQFLASPRPSGGDVGDAPADGCANRRWVQCSGDYAG
ncbi:hypothetical protein GCM10023405_13110 [Streptomonospora salina]